MNDSYRPLVSVITPTYNHSLFIDRCLDSVQEQTYSNWEQIIIDDGSTDSTPAIIASHSDSRVRCVRREHQGTAGLGNAYNTALRDSNGELVALLEGDDFWPPSKLEMQVPIFRRRNRLLCWGRGAVVDTSGKTLSLVSTLRAAGGVTDLGPTDLVPMMLIDNFISPSSGVLLRRHALDRIGGFSQPKGVPYVDLPTWLKLLASMDQSERFTFVRQTAVNFRSHPAQVSRKYDHMVASRAKVIEELVGEFDSSLATRLGLHAGYVNAVVQYHRARIDLVNRKWADAFSGFAACLGDAEKPLRARAWLGIGACLFRYDLFRLVPNTLRFRAFGLVLRRESERARSEASIPSG